MPSPNLRRRNSIGLDPRRRCLLLRAHKSNPHIGWSRHAPDTSFLSQSHPTPKSRAFRGSLKSSPYVGWFRHAPATLQVFANTSRDEFYERLARKWIEEEIHYYLKSLPSSKSSSYGSEVEVRCLSELLRTRLPGGNDEHGLATTSSLKVLQHLKTWLLLPFQEDEMDERSWNIKSIDQDQMTLEGEASDGDSESEDEQDDSYNENNDDDYSDYSASEDPATGESSDYSGRAPVNALDTGISSQAEAYYAHQVTSELAVNPDDHTTVLPSPSSSRLDYVITQMDIVRMHRNASRHLEVESIYKLPTITYRAAAAGAARNDDASNTVEESTKVSKSMEKSVEGWSWMFIPSDKKKIDDASSIIVEGESDDEESKSEQSNNVCVICLERFVEGDRLRVLPCDHSFHVGCIDKWLSGSCSFDECHTAGCPTCKKRADTGMDASRLDGSVPSWAFAQLGRSLAREGSEC